MTFERFKKIFGILEVQPISNEISEKELEEFHKMQEASRECYEWVLNQRINNAEVRIPAQCCTEMSFHLIEYFKEQRTLLSDPEYINYDAVVVCDGTQNAYGIPIHDGGSSYIQIAFCPWCGQKLPSTI